MRKFVYPHRALFFGVLLSAPFFMSAQNANFQSTYGEGALVDTKTQQAVTQNNETSYRMGARSILVEGIVDDLLLKYSTTVSNDVVLSDQFTTVGCQRGGSDQDYFLERITPQKGISKQYVPEELVRINDAITVRGDYTVCATKKTANALQRMFNAMESQGLSPVVTSAYRSSTQQSRLYSNYAPRYNNGPYKRVAQPGHSEHQLGTAVDLAGASQGYLAGARFASSPEYRWLMAYAQEYGFVSSYSLGKESTTGYQYEPWHWRYVGQEAAVILNSFDHSLSHSQEYQSPLFVFQALVDFMEYASPYSIEVGG